MESLNTRGLLLGRAYASGDATRGVWGLFGNYDYISPQVFRVSSTALSLGTTWQSWLAPAVALQGTALAGAVSQGRRPSVLVNNRSEGNAPLTVQALSEILRG